MSVRPRLLFQKRLLQEEDKRDGHLCVNGRAFLEAACLQGKQTTRKERGTTPFMGYGTWFTGKLKLDQHLASHHLAYLHAFHRAEHVWWDGEWMKKEPDLVRQAVGLSLGEYGCYFIGRGFKGEYSYPPWIYRGEAPTDPAYLGGICPGVPGHRCPWCPSVDGTGLLVNSDKPYGYVRWLQYLLTHFLIPWGYVLHGEMTWQGEDEEDQGALMVEQNIVTVLKGKQSN